MKKLKLLITFLVIFGANLSAQQNDRIDPVNVFDQVWETLDNNYPYFNYRGGIGIVIHDIYSEKVNSPDGKTVLNGEEWKAGHSRVLEKPEDEKNISKEINIQEKIELGGAKQWIQIRGEDTTNPILLFLHGGPGFPEMPFAYIDSKELEKHFIVVNWDQRGCGKSYDKNLSMETITLEQILSDTKELVDYLKNRFNKEKIFLIGHSWGSILGMYSVYNHPNDFYAYVGMGQVVDSKKGEIIGYNYALNKAEEAKDSIAIDQLKKIGLPPYDNYNSISIRARIVSKYKGNFAGEFSYPGLIRIVNQSPDYNQEDKQTFMNAYIQVTNKLWSHVSAADFMWIKEIKIPVYFFLGKYDYATPSQLTEDFYEKLKAPYKEIVWFENSGHYPNLEEPEKYQDVLINKVLRNTLLK